MTDRADLAERLDAVGEALDTRELDPLFVFTNGDGDLVDKHGRPLPEGKSGSLPGVFVLPNSVTDEWGRQ